MATRTVRLDDEAEQALEDVRKATGLPISEALKRGLRTLRDEVRAAPARSAYEIFKELEPGPSGSAVAPSTDVRRGVRSAIRKKLGR
jgi:hypothetical protein